MEKYDPDEAAIINQFTKIENVQLKKDIEEFLRADEVFKQKRRNLSEIKTKSHPQAYHTSRLLDFTKNLNDILEQEEKKLCETISQKIIINDEEDNFNDETTLSENLGTSFLYLISFFCC